MWLFAHAQFILRVYRDQYTSSRLLCIRYDVWHVFKFGFYSFRVGFCEGVTARMINRAKSFAMIDCRAPPNFLLIDENYCVII